MKFTHFGYIVGCDARTPVNYKRKVNLRETKMFWISENGFRFSKKHYGKTSGSWPMWRIDLKSIKPISQ